MHVKTFITADGQRGRVELLGTSVIIKAERESSNADTTAWKVTSCSVRLIEEPRDSLWQEASPTDAAAIEGAVGLRRRDIVRGLQRALERME